MNNNINFGGGADIYLHMRKRMEEGTFDLLGKRSIDENDDSEVGAEFRKVAQRYGTTVSDLMEILNNSSPTHSARVGFDRKMIVEGRTLTGRRMKTPRKLSVSGEVNEGRSDVRLAARVPEKLAYAFEAVRRKTDHASRKDAFTAALARWLEQDEVPEVPPNDGQPDIVFQVRVDQDVLDAFEKAAEETGMRKKALMTQVMQGFIDGLNPDGG
ncbi:MAG: hypothetical protein AAF311_10415 [Pseudomonadota bacterium]